MTELEAVSPEERFQNFLKSFVTEGRQPKYRGRLAQLSVTNARSLLVDFQDLCLFDQSLANKIIEKPDEYLKLVDKAALEALKVEDPEYADEVKEVHVRFSNLPSKSSLREVGADDIGKLVMVDGILVRATPVMPLLMKGAFKCRSCKETSLLDQEGYFLVKPQVCPSCGKGGRLDLVEEGSEFINSQQIRIQERPEDLPPGQLPRAVRVRLLEDLVDVARPGDRVSVIGTVRAYQQFISRFGLRTFDLSMDANYVDIAGREIEAVRITPEEEEEILKLSKDEFVFRKIIRSIAPSIYGYESIKEAILLLLFSGVPKIMPDGVSIRGDINVLLIGDPGTAKSQLLQYVARIAPRGLYTSGRGTTAAGLTAAVLREKDGGMVLEAGALVLSDKGVCAIDEFDKMRPEDRVAIHEAMEQQTVSVAKGGIVATLNARSSILAAANPALGRYDLYRNVTENINLPVTVLSRFDLIFVLKDRPDKEEDTKMSEHILTLHKTMATPEESPITPQLLRKYVSYSKRFKPKLTDEAAERFEDFYIKMRSGSEGKDSPIAITPRQLESLVRLAEARTRSCLRSEVTAEDAEAVILLMQQSLKQVGIDLTTGKLDIDVIMTGKPKSVRDKLTAVISTVVDMEKATGIVNLEELYARLKQEFDIDRPVAERLVSQMQSEGALYTPKPGYIKKA